MKRICKPATREGGWTAQWWVDMKRGDESDAGVRGVELGSVTSGEHARHELLRPAIPRRDQR